ncbi:MAG: hypothetical protein IJ874_07490 [Ruminococcus sp.]|nr:hypothetical protein [Ruminococcus sp.]
MEKDKLSKINRFTNREFSADELYTFKVILCDNDIDRDGERFSDKALDSLGELFVGKTGITDHEPSAANQTARIFDTRVVTDESRHTFAGDTYRYLEADAYMVRTADNADLITRIDGGIHKEVSISCSAGKRTCSVCGCGSCSHVPGKSYGGRLCCRVLDDISDAYEWSFVAVPAQRNAGVTKHFVSGRDNAAVLRDTARAEEEIRCEIRRFAYFTGGRTAAAAAELSAKSLDLPQLIELKSSLERLSKGCGIAIQLMPDSCGGDNISAYRTGAEEVRT